MNMIKEYLRYIFVALAFSVSLSGCTKYGDADLFTSLTLVAELPDGTTPVVVTPDNNLKGTFIMNINTLQEFDYPSFVGGHCCLVIPRGVYVFSFDGTATLGDGSRLKVRYSGHNTYESAITLLGESEEMVVKLTVLK